VFRFLSVNNIVIAPAKTGRAIINKTEVTKIDQQNNGNRAISIPRALIFKIVTIKFIAPIIDDAPAKCRLKITQSTEELECPTKLLNGGYKVHPVPAPPSIHPESNNNVKEAGKSQKLKLFKRGKAISGAPINKGTIQFPKPPNKIGMATKNIIIKPCEVTIVLYS
jgi:hypothetical protein